jgi:hypothetical protein
MEIIAPRILQTHFDVFSTADIEMHSKESILKSEIIRNHYFIFDFFGLPIKGGDNKKETM